MNEVVDQTMIDHNVHVCNIIEGNPIQNGSYQKCRPPLLLPVGDVAIIVTADTDVIATLFLLSLILQPSSMWLSVVPSLFCSSCTKHSTTASQLVCSEQLEI